MDRTLDRLKSVGFWVEMNSDVESYVASCEVCQKAKILCKAPLINTPASRVLQLLQVDVLEVPISVEGNRYLLVVEDAFSKWVECHPMKDQRGVPITKLL